MLGHRAICNSINKMASVVRQKYHALITTACILVNGFEDSRVLLDPSQRLLLTRCLNRDVTAAKRISVEGGCELWECCSISVCKEGVRRLKDDGVCRVCAGKNGVPGISKIFLNLSLENWKDLSSVPSNGQLNLKSQFLEIYWF